MITPVGTGFPSVPARSGSHGASAGTGAQRSGARAPQPCPEPDDPGPPNALITAFGPALSDLDDLVIVSYARGVKDERTLLHELVDQLPDDRLDQATALLEKMVGTALRREFKSTASAGESWPSGFAQNS